MVDSSHCTRTMETLQAPLQIEQLQHGLGEYNKTLEEEQRCLKEIYSFIKEDETTCEYLKYAIDEIFLILVRAYNCNSSAAWKVLKNLQYFATVKYRDLFDKVDTTKIGPMLDMKCYEVVKLPEPGSKEPGVICFRTKNWNTEYADTDDLIAAGVLYIYRMAMDSVEVQRNGIIAVLDIEGFGFKHVRHCTYDLATKMLHCLTYANPVKIIAYVAINSHPLFEKSYHVLKYVVPERFRKHIYICKQTYEHLHKLIDTKHLPMSLGGKLSEENGWVKNIESKIHSDPELHRIINILMDEAQKYFENQKNKTLPKYKLLKDV